MNNPENILMEYLLQMKILQNYGNHMHENTGEQGSSKDFITCRVK